MLQTIDIKQEEVKVTYDKRGLLVLQYGYDEINIFINNETAKSLCNVMRKVYPAYETNAKTDKVCIVFDSQQTPTAEMQTFLKGLKLNEVIA